MKFYQKVILVSIPSFMFLSCGSPEDTFNEKPDFVAEIEKKIDLEKCDANNCEACDFDTCQEHKDSCAGTSKKYACGNTCTAVIRYCVPCLNETDEYVPACTEYPWTG